jgi:hypothetical protein
MQRSVGRLSSVKSVRILMNDAEIKMQGLVYRSLSRWKMHKQTAVTRRCWNGQTKYEALGFLSHRVMTSTETMSSLAIHRKFKIPKLHLVLKERLEEEMDVVLKERLEAEMDLAEAVGFSCFMACNPAASGRNLLRCIKLKPKSESEPRRFNILADSDVASGFGGGHRGGTIWRVHISELGETQPVKKP